ncbi:DMT family transporter [Candidatus Roizmanbacteria bacterium]|nr:DMT family transporter [Candidatus Roizmanbacteria bacterium]
MNPFLALIVANIIWGIASPVFKFALTDIPPFTLAFIRFFFAALLFFPLVKKWSLHTLSKKEWVELLLGAFFGITVNITFFFLGLKKADSINAPIIASAGPVFLYFLSVLFLHEKANRKVLTGMLVSLAGVLVIILSPIFLDSKRLVFGEVEGNIYFVIATFGAMLHPLFYKNILKKISVYQVTFISFFFSALTFLPFMLREFQSWSITTLHVAGWTGIVFGVIFSSALAYYLYNYGLSKINAQEVGMFSYIDPVAAIIIAIPLVHEYPNAYFFFGSLLVFGGIFFAERRIHWHPFGKLKKLRNLLQ